MGTIHIVQRPNGNFIINISQNDDTHELVLIPREEDDMKNSKTNQIKEVIKSNRFCALNKIVICLDKQIKNL